MSRRITLLATVLAGTVTLATLTAAPVQAAELPSRTRVAVVDAANAGRSFNLAAALTQHSVTAAAATVTVASGDTLSRLASRHCGSGNWTGIYQDNQSVVGSNPNLIYPGQQLVINCTTRAAAANPPAAAPAPVSTGWVTPVDACITSGYGSRWGSWHAGTDLGAGHGTPIRAAAAGTLSVGWQAGGAGNYSTINHGDGLWTVYMHQSSFAVTSGWVAAGQTIGYVGSTGQVTGPHLHFEVHTGGLWNGKVNPTGFMAARGAALGC